MSIALFIVMYLVGIDCATKPKFVGIALAKMTHEVHVCEVHAAIKDPWKAVFRWLETFRSERILIAIDAPLGWPAPLGQSLNTHSAGDPIDADSNKLFSRFTDRYIRQEVGKKPLEVGADRIARTAHAALQELAILRQESQDAIPLAWSHQGLSGMSVIEVYPAATLKAHDLPSNGYKDNKDPKHKRVRTKILDSFTSFHVPLECRNIAIRNSDGFDAVVCLLAAADFAGGNALPPPDYQQAQKEGWIWCRGSDTP